VCPSAELGPSANKVENLGAWAYRRREDSTLDSTRKLEASESVEGLTKGLGGMNQGMQVKIKYNKTVKEVTAIEH
jgi:hypothetical protein